ncbi:MAG: hypothetical protein M1834_003292 [Cirrosporium novae-zelandiae]|nr:MAG: hypothetical protein M1834_003292 [Cirrosporium novae-zelandiae]
MSKDYLPYTTLDVFTAERLQGNQLAVVEVGSRSLSPEQKLKITREFNFSETVFLHEVEQPGQKCRIEIFTLTGELDFAGHPVIGSGHYLFKNKLAVEGGGDAQLDGQHATLITKSGPVTIQYDRANQTVTANIPHNVHVHSHKIARDQILSTQPHLKLVAETSNMKDEYPMTSIVKGVTFALIDLTDVPSLITQLKRGDSPQVQMDETWLPSFIGCMYYRRVSSDSSSSPSVEHLHVRMIAIGLEDPACGSGSSALAAYLSLQKGDKNGKYVYRIDQGLEMGRRSHIIVNVQLDDQGTGIASIALTGQAAFTMEGKLFLTG